MALPAVPPGFIDLPSAFDQVGSPYNIIGVCTDFLPATKSAGTDFTIKFTLSDPRWFQGNGMTFRFFHKNEKRLPKIENQGDVLVLKNIKTTERYGQKLGWSNGASMWAVLEHSSVFDSNADNGADIVVHTSDGFSGHGVRPSVGELQYAKAILHLQDRNSWPAPAKATSLQVSAIMQSQGGTALPKKEKFRLISDLEPPSNHDSHYFAELFGEVRKLFSNDFRVELSVTDYTENSFLYNYKYGIDEGCFDGDEFGYTVGTTTQWPGPWGKRTMAITLWPPHDGFARSEVQEGSFVYLRNVQIKFDRNGAKLEGHCRGDRVNPTKINISVFKPREAESDQRFKDLLHRKREYETKAKAQQRSFQRHPHTKRKIGGDGHNDVVETKSKKYRDKKQKKMARIEARRGTDKEKSNVKTTAADSKPLIQKINTHVRTNNIDINLTRITDILDPTFLIRTTPRGNSYSLPFQNCCYKSKVRVVDYFPDNIADFAAPVRENMYDVLSDDDDSDKDHDSDFDGDIMMSNYGSIANNGIDSSNRNPDGNTIRWEWRFSLLVEDAQASAATTLSKNLSLDPDRTQMPLLIAGTDGDYLLRMEACNLRDPQNATALAQLKEKLFVLWGDLAERKEEIADANNTATPNGETSENGRDQESINGNGVKPRARPFECFIKEYGVARRRASHSSSGNREGGIEKDDYERMFRLCYTTI